MKDKTQLEAIVEIIDNISYVEDGIRDAARQILDLCQPKWIDVNERLPEYNTMVALIDINRYANNGDIEINNPHVNMCGYLTNFGCDYWSIYGQRGLNLDAFTHWMPLPEPPGESE